MKINKKISKEEYDRFKRIEEAAKTVCLANVGDIQAKHKYYYELEEALKPIEPEFIEGHLYWYRYGKNSLMSRMDNDDSFPSTKMLRFYNPGDEKNYTITKLKDQDWLDIGAYLIYEV